MFSDDNDTLKFTYQLFFFFETTWQQICYSHKSRNKSSKWEAQNEAIFP